MQAAEVIGRTFSYKSEAWLWPIFLAPELPYWSMQQFFACRVMDDKSSSGYQFHHLPNSPQPICLLGVF